MDNQTVLEDHERRIVAAIFTWGLSLSSLAMVVGFLIGLVSGDTALGSVDVAHLGDLSAAGALMAVGIGILAATPVANIGALLYYWARQRRFGMTLICLTVLLTLVIAMIGAGVSNG